MKEEKDPSQDEAPGEVQEEELKTPPEAVKEEVVESKEEEQQEVKEEEIKKELKIPIDPPLPPPPPIKKEKPPAKVWTEEEIEGKVRVKLEQLHCSNGKESFFVTRRTHSDLPFGEVSSGHCGFGGFFISGQCS